MIEVCLLPVSEHKIFYHLIADRVLLSGFSFAPFFVCLAKGELEKFTPNETEFSLPAIDRSVDALTIYDGQGWVGGQWRNVCVQTDDRGYLIDVATIGDFYIAGDGAVIYVQWSQLQQNRAYFIEALLGPALALALALQGTFCLHTSAVALDGQAIMFIGESGWGKSTLAAFLNGEVGSAWQRVADDVLPVLADDRGVVCLPHFPQLKLPEAQQWNVDSPRRLPLTAVYIISPPDSQNDNVHIQPLNSVEATLALVRHTVAAKLFDDQLLTRHLAFMATIADQVPVKRLTYPRIFAELPAVSAALANDLAA